MRLLKVVFSFKVQRSGHGQKKETKQKTKEEQVFQRNCAWE